MARIIDSVIGHKPEIAQLFTLKQAGRWPHAIMFVGPSGIGKKKMALGFAQALVCEQSNEACGVCGACIRIEKQQSESLTILQPDPELSRPVIKVEKVRDLLDSLSLAAMDGGARVVIIDQAQTMNPQASNALLKTLEEPSENIFFILIANDVHQFLPTIRSRTQVMRFTALSYDEVKTLKPDLPDWTYRSCRGQIDRLELLSSPEGKVQREEALTFFEQFCSDENFLTDKTWKDSVKDRSWAIFSLNCWLLMARDAVVLKTQAQKFILNTDQSERLKALYSVPASKLLWLCQHLIMAEKDINQNADTSLVFENLWIQYARVD
ncbi:MAG: DNA polymerase III subunit [Pseudobdellovibrio sp.]